MTMEAVKTNEKNVEDLLAMMGIGTIEVKREISGYKYLIYGSQKVGKTSLAYQIAKAEYGDPKAAFFAEFEVGTSAAIGAMSKRMRTWADFLNVISGFEQIVAKGMTLPIKMFVIDTVDIAVGMAEKFVVARGKANSLNTLGGGFGRGHQILADEILDALNRLEALGLGIIIISHEKSRDTTDINGNTFKEIDNTITGKPRQVVNGFVDFICYIDQVRTFEEVVINDEIVNRKKDEKRVIRFRGDTRVKSGARFPDIVNYVDYGAGNFINAIKDAIEAQAKDINALERIEAQNAELKKEKIEVLGDQVGGSTTLFAEEIDESTPVIELIKNYFKEAPTKKTYLQQLLVDRGIDVKNQKELERQRKTVIEAIGLSRRDDQSASVQ